MKGLQYEFLSSKSHPPPIRFMLRLQRYTDPHLRIWTVKYRFKKWIGGVHLSEAIRHARSSSSVDRFCSAVAQMKAKIPYFWNWGIDLVAYKPILPKNEANHRRIGYFETIYFLNSYGLVWPGIVSTGRVLTFQAVYGCYNSSPMAISDPEPTKPTNQTPDRVQFEHPDYVKSGTCLNELHGIGIRYGLRIWVVASLTILDSWHAHHTVDTEPYQSTVVNCLKVTDSSVVRLIFREDPLIGEQIDASIPKIWDLSFHLGYRWAKSVDGARRSSGTLCLGGVYLPSSKSSKRQYPASFADSHHNNCRPGLS